jgi:hypothetical protein
MERSARNNPGSALANFLLGHIMMLMMMVLGLCMPNANLGSQCLQTPNAGCQYLDAGLRCTVAL